MKKTSIIILLLAMTLNMAAQRTERVISNWRFSHSDKEEQKAVSYDDKAWQEVKVPHDWAISGPFDKDIDKQVVAIEQNGEKEATEKTGRSGCLPWIGTGWYRTHVNIPANTERAILNFDGAMSEPTVYVNGQLAGEWKYGYNAFNIDITPFLNHKGDDNVIAVRLQNIEESSRWYPGAGLIRPVTLTTTQRRAFMPWGVEAATQSLTNSGDVVEKLKASVTGRSENLKVEFIITPERGRSITWRGSADVVRGEAMAMPTIEGVDLWSPEQPTLYTLTAQLIDKSNGNVIDETVQKIGFRTVRYSAERGFELNGHRRKFKGVCLHHDLGMIGAAVNKSALIRQVKLLKTMGCDAIRTSHNMPSQLQMDVCDSLGMLVMAESFDMWVYPKCKNGYARFFEEWADRDIENLVRANHNHPSIVMWSIGNEIPEQGMKEGAKIVRHLQNLVHSLDNDPGRLVTTGMDRIDNAISTGFAQVIDIPGMNYRTHKYEMAQEKLGHGFILGSETASTVSSRGVYKFPVERIDNKAWNDGQCSGYDVEACWWANIPEDDWTLQDDKTWTIGEFVWTGFDYLGEPTPYDEYWPSRSSYFGIFDLAGLPKDRYYLYRSRWNRHEPTIHLLPHWSWKGREGEVTPVYCYTNYPTAELFVNGKSQGRRTKALDAIKNYNERITDIKDPSIDRYRLRWNDVVYEPGELKVVVYDAEGNERGTEIVHTAGKPAKIELTGDLGEAIEPLHAGTDDLVFITVNILDKNGILCPDADNAITIDVKGAAKFRGICNGDATSLEVFTRPVMHAFHGQLVFAVEPTALKGLATITVKGKGIGSRTIKINAE